jgi:hypothetical protein
LEENMHSVAELKEYHDVQDFEEYSDQGRLKDQPFDFSEIFPKKL